MDSRQVGIRQQRSLDRARRERPSTPAVIQRGQATRHAAASGSGGTSLYIGRVVSQATGRGFYLVSERQLDATTWNTDAEEQLIAKSGGASGYAYNVAEERTAGSGSHALVPGDEVIFWPVTDDEGNARYLCLPACGLSLSYVAP